MIWIAHYKQLFLTIYCKGSLQHIYICIYEHIAKHNCIITCYITYSRYTYRTICSSQIISPLTNSPL